MNEEEMIRLAKAASLADNGLARTVKHVPRSASISGNDTIGGTSSLMLHKSLASSLKLALELQLEELKTHEEGYRHSASLRSNPKDILRVRRVEQRRRPTSVYRGKQEITEITSRGKLENIKQLYHYPY